MDCRKKYALMEPIPGEGASSFRGRALLSGREVTVHLLPGGNSANETSLFRIRTLPPESLSQIIEVGEHDGILYLVTAAPPHQHFSEWLPNQERVSSGSGGSEPGEFTRFFQGNSLRPEQSHDPVMPPATDGPGPGEFTRLMGPALPLAKQTSDARGSSPVTPRGFTSILRAPSDSPQTPPADSGPEATQAFTISASQFNPPRAEQGPSEYTRVIARPLTPQNPPAPQTVTSTVDSPTQEPAPTLPVAAKTAQLNLLVTAMLCLLSFLAGGTLVFLILRH